MKLVLAGIPHTGKSCLRALLKRALKPLAARRGLYPYAIDANPDGEGSWYQEAVREDRAGADYHRQNQKRPFTDDFAGRVAQHVRDCSEPLVLVDIGGRIDDKQHQICAGATHILILYRAEDDRDMWRDFARERGLTVIAELRSVHDAEHDVIYATEPILDALVHHLERGVLDEPHPAIDALAELILTMTEFSMKEAVTEPERPFVLARHGRVLKLSFGLPASGDVVVEDIEQGLDKLEEAGALGGGGIIGLNGPCSLAGMAVLAHRLTHRFAAVAVFDPKLPAYIVAVSHDPRWSPGDLLTSLDD